MVPRSWVSRACLLLVPIVATGCALVSDSDPESSSSSSESPSHSEAGGQAFPVTIDHKFGSTTITEKPVRVVTVGLNEQDALLALGVVPVGTTHWFGDEPGDIFPWARDALGDAPVPKVLDSEQEFESVAALEPDLIVAMYAGISKDDYRLLSQIAPTLAQPKGYVNYGVPWQETTRTVGLALGQADEADKLVDDVEALIASQRDAHPEFAGSTAVVATLYEGIFVYGPEDPRGRLLTDLGFTFPEELTDVGQDEFGGSISVENADLVSQCHSRPSLQHQYRTNKIPMPSTISRKFVTLVKFPPLTSRPDS